MWIFLLVTLATLPMALFAIGHLERTLGLESHYWTSIVNCLIYVYGTLMGELIRKKSYFGNAWASR